MARKHLNIGGKIQARRKAMGLSQEDLAQLTGVSRQSVTKWETGQSAPDLDRLVEVSDVLGVSLDFLLREPQQVSSPPSFAVADSPPFAEDGSPGASGVPRGIDSSLNGMAPAVAVERVASCGQVPVAPFGRETDGLLGITKRSSAPLSGISERSSGLPETLPPESASPTVLLAKKIDSSDGIRGCSFLFHIEHLDAVFVYKPLTLNRLSCIL